MMTREKADAPIGLRRTEFVSIFNSQEEYPLSTEEAAWVLRLRGYDCKGHTLDYFVKKKIVAPRLNGKSYSWDAEDIDIAAVYLESHSILSEIATTVKTLGGRLFDYYRALHIASEMAKGEFPLAIPPYGLDPNYFLLHVYPPSGGANAIFRFELTGEARVILRAEQESRKAYFQHLKNEDQTECHEL